VEPPNSKETSGDPSDRGPYDAQHSPRKRGRDGGEDAQECRHGRRSAEAGATHDLAGYRLGLERDGKHVAAHDDEDFTLRVPRVDELSILPHRLDARDVHAGAVVGDVQGYRASVREGHPAVFLDLGSGKLEDGVDLVPGHAVFYPEAGSESMVGYPARMPRAADAAGDSKGEEENDGARVPSSRTTDIVVLKEVHKSFGDQEVLKGIDLVFRRKETTCVVGGSGAGKTTLLRLVVALDRPTSGHIFVDGEDTVGMGERELNRVRQKFGMVYQYAALLDSISVLDNVSFPLVEHTHLSRKEIRKRVMDKLSALGLDETVLAKYPAELSGGMRKRVGLARALMLEPPIVVYDEPTSGLDPLTSRSVDDLIDDTRHRFGVTSLVITHDIASCFRIADQAVLLVQGEIVARGTPYELAHGESDVARDFIQKSGVDVDAIWKERKR